MKTLIFKIKHIPIQLCVRPTLLINNNINIFSTSLMNRPRIMLYTLGFRDTSSGQGQKVQCGLVTRLHPYMEVEVECRRLTVS